MAKANMRYTKIEDGQLREAIETLLAYHDWDKKDLAELQAALALCEEYRDYWFTRTTVHWSSKRKGTLMMATEPGVKLVGNLRGVYATYKRNQFNIVNYIDGGKLSYYGSTEGLKCYLKERAERGEDTVFRQQVNECVRRLKLNYEKNTLRNLRRFTEERVTEEYIRDHVKQHLVTISQGNSNGLHWNWVDYTMFLQRKEVSRWENSIPILKPNPVMFDADILDYMRSAMSVSTLKRDGFTGEAIAAAIPNVVEDCWEDTVAAIRLAETAARSWCAVWTELIGDEEE
jgi:hypothetical protein|tara:strand:- start:2265 stop:3125 length:861 start_codon:yes stop_codon:yes gene_type:complete